MAHEDLNREVHIEGSSDRSFGFVFAGVFTVIAAGPLLAGNTVRWWAAAVAAAFAAIAIVAPSLLRVPNRLWMKFGLLLGKVVSPIALGVLYCGAIAPMGVAMRWLGKDPLRLKLDAQAKTYWIERRPPGPLPESMTNQF
jgi:Saxitoxin biosynthesis operon protein SxtJ